MKKEFFNQLLQKNRKEEVIELVPERPKIFNDENLIQSNQILYSIQPSEEDLMAEFFKFKIPKILESLNKYNKMENREFLHNRYNKFFNI